MNTKKSSEKLNPTTDEVAGGVLLGVTLCLALLGLKTLVSSEPKPRVPRSERKEQDILSQMAEEEWK